MARTRFNNPIFVALDTRCVDGALALTKNLKAHVGGIKLGLAFFCANGPKGIEALKASNMPVFLDLKLHDIPNTVAGAVKSLAPIAPALLTLHTQGGEEMMKRAVESAKEEAQRLNVPAPKLLGVTIMTSLGEEDLRAQGGDGDVSAYVERLAKLAESAGLDGLVCSALEVDMLRSELDPDMMLVVPGIRPEGSEAGDQKRVLTPRKALEKGADILVIGRPITQAPDPQVAAQSIASQLY